MLIVPKRPRTRKPQGIIEQCEDMTAKFENAVGLLTTAYRSRDNIPNADAAQLWHMPKSERPACSAKTRKGTPCRARALPGKNRCRNHGGMCTGPKTAEGRARIGESNRRRAADRRESQARKAEQ